VVGAVFLAIVTDSDGGDPRAKRHGKMHEIRVGDLCPAQQVRPHHASAEQADGVRHEAMVPDARQALQALEDDRARPSSFRRALTSSNVAPATWALTGRSFTPLRYSPAPVERVPRLAAS